MGVLLAGAGPAQLVETLAAPGSRGDGVDLGVNTCRARHRENKDEVWAGGRGARQVTASLSPPTVCSKIKSGPARCKSPRKTKLRQDDLGTPPPPSTDRWAPTRRAGV